MAFPALSRTNADVAGTDRDVAVLGGEQAREHADLDACTRQRSCTVAGIRDRGTVVVGSVVEGRSPMAVQRHRIAGIRERVHSLVQVGGGLTL